MLRSAHRLMNCSRLRLAAVAGLTLLTVALGASALRAQSSTKYVVKGSFLQAPELLPLPPVELPPVERPPVERLPEVDDPFDNTDASNTADAAEPSPSEGAVEADPGEGVSGLVDIDLLPGPDDLLIKGEEALVAVEEYSRVESWLMRPLQLWSASFEFGLSGSSGNNDVLDLRFGGHVKRVTDHRRFTADLNYKTVSQGATTITDRLFAESRHEWLIKDSPWAPYVHGTAEYDRVRNFGIRLNTDAGFGYQFYETDIASLLGRVGAGVSTELDSEQERPVSEAVFGMDYERRVTSRQRLGGSVDYFPSWEDFTNYRVNIEAGWQVDIDQEGSLSLKLSMIDRYDSTPGDLIEPNDLDYAATLLWSF